MNREHRLLVNGHKFSVADPSDGGTEEIAERLQAVYPNAWIIVDPDYPPHLSLAQIEQARKTKMEAVAAANSAAIKATLARLEAAKSQSSASPADGRTLRDEYKLLNKKVGKKVVQKPCPGVGVCGNVLCDHRGMVSATPVADTRLVEVVMKKCEKDGYPISPAFATKHLLATSSKLVDAIKSAQAEINQRELKLHNTGRVSVPFERVQAIQVRIAYETREDGYVAPLHDTRDKVIHHLEEEDKLLLSDKPDVWNTFWTRSSRGEIANPLTAEFAKMLYSGEKKYREERAKHWAEIKKEQEDKGLSDTEVEKCMEQWEEDHKKPGTFGRPHGGVGSPYRKVSFGAYQSGVDEFGYLGNARAKFFPKQDAAVDKEELHKIPTTQLSPEQMEERANAFELKDVMAMINGLEANIKEQRDAISVNHRGLSNEEADAVTEKHIVAQLQLTAKRLVKENMELTAKNNKLKFERMNAIIDEPQVDSGMEDLHKWIELQANESLCNLLRNLEDKDFIAAMVEPEDETADIIIDSEFHINSYFVTVSLKMSTLLDELKCGWKSVYRSVLKKLDGMLPHDIVVNAYMMILQRLGEDNTLTEAAQTALWACTELSAKLEHRLNQMELQPFDLETEQDREFFQMIQGLLIARIETHRDGIDELLSDPFEAIENDDGLRDIDFEGNIVADLTEILKIDRPESWMSVQTLKVYEETLAKARQLHNMFATARNSPGRGTSEWRQRIVDELPENDTAALSTIVLELEGDSVGLFEITHYLILMNDRKDLPTTINYVMNKLSAKLMMEVFAETKRRITSGSDKTLNGLTIANALLSDVLDKVTLETEIQTKLFNFQFVNIKPEEQEDDPVIILCREMVDKPKTKSDPLQISLQKQIIETKLRTALSTSESGMNFKLAFFNAYDELSLEEKVRNNRGIEEELQEAFGQETSEQETSQEPENCHSRWVGFPHRRKDKHGADNDHDLYDYDDPFSSLRAKDGRPFFESEAGQTIKKAVDEEKRQFKESIDVKKQLPCDAAPSEFSPKISEYEKILREYERTMPRIPLFPLTEQIDPHALAKEYYNPPPKPVESDNGDGILGKEHDGLAPQDVLSESYKAALENNVEVDFTSLTGGDLIYADGRLLLPAPSRSGQSKNIDTESTPDGIEILDLRQQETEGPSQHNIGSFPFARDSKVIGLQEEEADELTQPIADDKDDQPSLGLSSTGCKVEHDGNGMMVKLPGRSGSQHKFLVGMKSGTNTPKLVESFDAYLGSIYRSREDFDDDEEMTGAIRIESTEDMERILRKPRPLPQIPVTKGRVRAVSEPGPISAVSEPNEDAIQLAELEPSSDAKTQVDAKGKGKAIDTAESKQSSLPQRPKVKFAEPESSPGPKLKVDIKGKSKTIDNEEGASFRAVFQDGDEGANIGPSSSYHATVEDDDEDEDDPELAEAIAQSLADLKQRLNRDSEAGPSTRREAKVDSVKDADNEAGPSIRREAKVDTVKGADNGAKGDSESVEIEDSPPTVDVPEHLAPDINSIMAEWKKQLTDAGEMLADKKVIYKGREHMIYDARPCKPKVEDKEGKVDRETYELHAKLDKKNFAIFKGKVVPGPASKEDVEHVKKHSNIKTDKVANLIIALCAGSAALAADFAKFAHDEVSLYIEMRGLIQSAYYKPGPFKWDAELMRWGTRLLEFRVKELEIRNSIQRTAVQSAVSARRGYTVIEEVPAAPKPPKKQSNKSLKIAAKRAARGN